MKKIIILTLIGIVLAVGLSFFLMNRSSKLKGQPAKTAMVTARAESGFKKEDLESSRVNSLIPLPPKSADQEKVIQDIRSELQTVMDLNQKINSVQQSKSAQLLRIQEQASIHQKILTDIQKASDVKKPAMPSREALLAQEKLRIIREETLRNKKILEDRTSTPKVS